MNTVKVSVRGVITMARIPKVPFPPKLPARALPHDAKSKRHLYSAGFTCSWKSILFWASAILAFLVFLVLLDLFG